MVKLAKSWAAEVEMHLLPYVDKPAQYLGGEYNSWEKDWQQAAATMVLLFPDLYEIGMSHLVRGGEPTAGISTGEGLCAGCGYGGINAKA